MRTWAQDEARIGLIPVIRRVWTPKGKRPVAVGRRRYQWVYVYAFVHPSTGEAFWLILPTVNTEVMSLSLRLFAEEVGAGPGNHIVLVLDGAGWHKSKGLEVPEGIHLVFLPPNSPELQPAERLWPLLNEVVANRAFESLDELEDVLVDRCNELDKQPEVIKGLANYHWWPMTTVDYRA